MKQLLRFKNYVFLLLVGITLASCSKKDSDELIQADPKLLSFGFYVEDNEGVIAQDYVISEVTGNAITISLPKEVDKSELVARFVTTENAVVTVAGAIQQAGTTAQDFTVPVDYIVTEGAVNARYTVSIVKAADYVWSRLSAYGADVVTSMVMKVNPKNGIPYFLYEGKRDASADQRALVTKFENNLWSFVGSDQGISEGEINTYLDIAFNKEGNPYIVYPDYTTTVSQSATVQYFNGTSWSVVGTKGHTEEKVTYGALGINPANNQPVYFGTFDGRNGPLGRRALAVSYFSGSSWSINQSIPGRDVAEFASLQVAKTVGDALYLGVFKNGGTQTYSVYKYENNVWTILADNIIEAGAGNHSLRDFDMDVDLQGNVYVVAADDATTGGVFNPRVKKYNAETKTWSQIGSVIPVNLNTTRSLSLAVSPVGVPYLLYRNEQQNPTVVGLDSETKDWTAPQVLESVVLTDDVYLDFAPNGIGYAAYRNEAGTIVLHKYDVPN